MAVNKKRGTGGQFFAVFLFLIYFAILFYFLFFSEEMGRANTNRYYHYNLEPFKEIKRFITQRESLGLPSVILNLAGNIVAFMPFGFFLPIFSNRCKVFFNTVFYSFELSLFVELIQLVTKVGTFDVDDILLNTIGGALGFVVFKIWIGIAKGKGNEKKRT